MILWGILTLTLQNCCRTQWKRYAHRVSLLLGGIAALLFIISLQPYAATVLFIFLVIKLLMLAGMR